MSERKIITAEYLVEMFGKYDTDMMLWLLAPFVAKTSEEANAFWDEMIRDLRATEPPSKGRDGAIEGYEHLRSAYNKLSVFERESIKKHLVEHIARHLKEKPNG